MKLKLLLCFIIIIGTFLDSFAQLTPTTYRSKNHVDLPEREVKKLTLIELEARGKKFPPSYLLGMRNDNMILATDISKGFREEANFVKSEVNLKKYDRLTMLNRKEKHTKMAFWGAIFGAAGYYLVQRQAVPKSYEVRNKVLLGQEPNNGVAEGIIGGIIGAGLGIIIGRYSAKRKINLRNNRHKAVRKLKEFSFYED